MYNNKFLIAGGTESAASTEVFNPAIHEFEEGMPLPASRDGATLSMLSSGNLLLVGGRTAGEELTQIDKYDFSQGTWSDGGKLSHPRAFHTAPATVGYSPILVVGGYHASQVLSSVELYDTVSAKFIEVQSLRTARIHHTQIDGVVAGGFDGSRFLSSVELFDWSSKTWKLGMPMRTSRRRHSAVKTQLGLLIVVGGENEDGVLSSAEIYDPKTDLWDKLPTLNEARSRFALLQQWDGTNDTLFAIGGMGPGGRPLRSCERLRVGDSSWTSCGRLVEARADPAVIQELGPIYVIGGVGENGRLASTEIYWPNP